MKKITTTLLFAFFYAMLIAQLPTNGLVGYFNFDNTLVNTTNTDTINGTGSFANDKCGAANSALSVVSPSIFPDAGVTIPASGNGARSVSLWFKSLASNAHSLFNYGPVNGCFGLAYDAQAGSVLIFGGSQDLSFALSNATIWNHVVATTTATGATDLYINGVSVASANITFQTNTPFTSRIGRSPYSPATNYDNFLLDDLMLYNRALTAQEVSAIYAAQGGAPVITQQPSFPNAIVCVNDDEQLQLSVGATGNGLTYQWKLNGNNINNANDSIYYVSQSVPGTFSYSVVVSGSCGDVLSNSTIINIYNYPTPTIVQSGSLLQTQGFSAYQWRLNGVDIAGANGPNHTATQNGSYTVAVKNQDLLCEGVSPAVEVDLSVGIENIFSSAVTLYPNPATNLLNVETDEEIAQVEILNLQGQVMKTVTADFSSINISALCTGLYLARISTATQNTAMKKFAKQ